MENFIKSPYAEWLKLNVSFEILKNNDEKKYFHLVERIEEKLRKKYEENLLKSAEECPEVKKMEMRVIELEGRNLFKESKKMYLEKNRLTKFEKRGENEGREIYMFNYEKSS